jgi:hypothetical protein
MAVNMAYMPKPASGTTVLKMTPTRNGSVDIPVALTSKKEKR